MLVAIVLTAGILSCLSVSAALFVRRGVQFTKLRYAGPFLLLSLAVLDAGMLLYRFLPSTLAVALALDRIGAVALAIAGPYFALKLGGMGARLWLTAGSVVAVCCLVVAMVLTPLPLRIFLWLSILLTVVGAFAIRDRLSERVEIILWKRSFGFFMVALPLVTISQLLIQVPTLRELRGTIGGLDIGLLSCGIAAALALPFREPKPATDDAEIARVALGAADLSGEASILNLMSPREREIALLLREGLSYKEIAQRLRSSYKTIDHHIQSLYRKLGVGSRHRLVELLRRRG